jgi:hypothetical protein
LFAAHDVQADAPAAEHAAQLLWHEEQTRFVVVVHAVASYDPAVHAVAQLAHVSAFPVDVWYVPASQGPQVSGLAAVCL